MTTTAGSERAPLSRESGIQHSGLTASEAATRLADIGPNSLPPMTHPAVWRRVAAQLRDPLVLVLLAAAALTLITADWPDAAVIALVVTGNTVAGVVQEIRADAAITALAALATPAVRVVRDGTQITVPAAEIVPGDRILLGEGDVVPADADLLEASALLVDEAALTGESVAVGKVSAGVEDAGSLRAGTVVVRGRAAAVVTMTGSNSTLGRIAALVQASPPMTPLQRKLAELGRVLAAGVILLCLLELGLGLSLGQPVELMVVTAISLAVAAVPESLPAVVALGLALGARRMARQGAVIRRLSAVETLGSVQVLVTDKTGTLTEGRMVVEEVWTPSLTARFAGVGYAPVGEVFIDGELVDPKQQPSLQALLSSAALCNDAKLRRDDESARRVGEWVALGDPTEAAILAAAGKAAIDLDRLRLDAPRQAELPFDSLRRRMTTVHREVAGGWLVCTKGALEALLDNGLTNSPVELAEAKDQAEALAGTGLRVLAVATAHSDEQPREEQAESGLQLLGLIALNDPPKPTAVATIAACRAAGIEIVVATGDHPGTARSISHRVGVLSRHSPAGTVVTGVDIREGRVPDLTSCRVLARTNPEQKLAVIEAWQAKGAVVAMVGDGVNDAPALRRADIGVSMGRRGTEVARQAADLVLADDELGTLILAVQEGRRVYSNIRRFLTYALSGGAAELLVMLLGPALGMTVPLLPAQILWVNLLTHGLTGVAFGAEPSDPGVMHQPPRSPTQHVLGGGVWQRVLRLSVVIAAASLGVGLTVKSGGGEWQSAIFLTITTGQLGVALGMRAQPLSLLNWPLLAAVSGSLTLVIAGVYLAPLQSLLSTHDISTGALATTLAIGAASFALTMLDRRLFRRDAAAEPG